MTAAGQEGGRKHHLEADASRSSVEAEGMDRTAEGGSCARTLVLVGNGRGHHQGRHQGDNCHPLYRVAVSECGMLHTVAEILWRLCWQTPVDETKCSLPACSQGSVVALVIAQSRCRKKSRQLRARQQRQEGASRVVLAAAEIPRSGFHIRSSLYTIPVITQ